MEYEKPLIWTSSHSDKFLRIFSCKVVHHFQVAGFIIHRLKSMIIRALAALRNISSSSTSFGFCPPSLSSATFCSRAMETAAHSLTFQPSSLDHVENVELYRPGGFHPVHLGDTFASGRYRVIHKLGFGGFSTVWLARDQSQKRYVALKIITAETWRDFTELKILQHLEKSSSEQSGRTYISSVLDCFKFEGPNGAHTCLVSNVGGPSIAQVHHHLGRSRRLRGDLARRLAGQAAQALAFLHANDVVHGGMVVVRIVSTLALIHLTDYSASNILIQLADIDAWSEQEVFDRLGCPIKDNVLTVSGSDINPSAPAYLMEPVVMSKIDPQWLRDEILVIDFGQSFVSGNPPASGLGTPLSYLAPEAIFDRQTSFWSDIWALGCTIFEIRSGTQLFASFFGNSAEILRQMVQTLGKLPEPWWNEWEQRYAYFDDQGKPKQTWANNIPLAVEYPLVEQINDIGTEDGDDEDEGVEKALDRKEQQLMERMGTKLTDKEADLLRDLLIKILKYPPNQRLSLENIIDHSWFSQ